MTTISPPAPEAQATPTSEVQAAFTPTPGRKKIAYRVETLWVPGPSLEGNLLGDATGRNATVLLPPNYKDSDDRYPVVYMLHGFSANESYGYDVLDGLQAASIAGSAKEMIVVVPNGDNKLGGSWYLSSPMLGDYEGYITKDLVNLVDSKYRTLAQRESRGISGCSLGADCAVQLALKHPSVYSVAAPMSGNYDLYDPDWLAETAQGLAKVPATFGEFALLGFPQKVWVSAAAGVAPNPDKPPFFFDMPYELVDGKVQAAPGFAGKRAAVDAMHEVEGYLQQPVRLNNILLYHAQDDNMGPVEYARAFDRRLTELGIEHIYVELPRGGHCPGDMDAVWKFMSDNLAFEPVAK